MTNWFNLLSVLTRRGRSSPGYPRASFNSTVTPILCDGLEAQDTDRDVTCQSFITIPKKLDYFLQPGQSPALTARKSPFCTLAVQSSRKWSCLAFELRRNPMTIFCLPEPEFLGRRATAPSVCDRRIAERSGRFPENLAKSTSTRIA